MVDAWETWESSDGSHTADDLEERKADLFTGLDLGIDADDLLTITDYPIEDPQPYSVHDRRACSPAPEPVEKERRLTRTSEAVLGPGVEPKKKRGWWPFS